MAREPLHPAEVPRVRLPRRTWVRHVRAKELHTIVFVFWSFLAPAQEFGPLVLGRVHGSPKRDSHMGIRPNRVNSF